MRCNFHLRGLCGTNKLRTKASTEQLTPSGKADITLAALRHLSGLSGIVKEKQSASNCQGNALAWTTHEQNLEVFNKTDHLWLIWLMFSIKTSLSQETTTLLHSFEAFNWLYKCVSKIYRIYLGCKYPKYSFVKTRFHATWHLRFMLNCVFFIGKVQHCLHSGAISRSFKPIFWGSCVAAKALFFCVWCLVTIVRTILADGCRRFT